jgi:hypothetical protein
MLCKASSGYISSIEISDWTNNMHCKVISDRTCFTLIACVLAFGAGKPHAAYAASATLNSTAELRTERFVDAMTLSRLAKGTSVETLKSEAGWVQIRFGKTVGWVRASQLSGVQFAAANRKEDGRSGPDNVMAISGIRSMPKAALNASSALTDIHAQRDISRIVSVMPAKPTLRIGRDKLDLTVSSSHDGYLYLIMLGSSNKSMYMLFPNGLDQDNAMKAGTAFKLPRKQWEINAQGPSGTDKMLAIVTTSPRDLTVLDKNKAGPFFIMPVKADGQPDLTWLLDTPAKSVTAGCQSSTAQDKAKAEQCRDTFGAALVDIVEQ